MQDYSYIYLTGMLLTNTGITPIQIIQNAYRGIFLYNVYLLKTECNTFFYTSCLLRYAFSKIYFNRILRRISKVKTVNKEHWKRTESNQMKFKHFFNKLHFKKYI